MAIRRRGLVSGLIALVPALSLLGSPSVARADDEELSVNWRGSLQSDLRFRTERKGVGDFYNRIELPEGPERNQNALSLKLDASYGRFKGVAQIDFALDGFSSDLQTIGDLYHI